MNAQRTYIKVLLIISAHRHVLKIGEENLFGIDIKSK